MARVFEPAEAYLDMPNDLNELAYADPGGAFGH